MPEGTATDLVPAGSEGVSQAATPEGVPPEKEATSGAKVEGPPGSAQQLYVVGFSMTSPNFIAETTELDEEIPEEERRRKEVVYALPKKVRQAIQAERMAAVYPIEKYLLPFYTMKLCSQDGMEEIQRAMAKADEDMKKIRTDAMQEAQQMLAELSKQLAIQPDPATTAQLQKRYEFATMTLEQLEEAGPGVDDHGEETEGKFKAEAEFLPLDLKQIAEGTLMDQIRFAIRNKIESVEQDVVKKVRIAKAKGKDLATRSEEAILTRLEQLDGINIIGDPGLADRVEHLRSLIILHKYGEIVTEFGGTKPAQGGEP